MRYIKEVNQLKHTSEEILKLIDEMENAERWKLVEELYYKFFDKGEEPEEEEEEEYEI